MQQRLQFEQFHLQPDADTFHLSVLELAKQYEDDSIHISI